MVGDFNIFLIITGKKNVFKDREDLNTAVAPVTPTPCIPGQQRPLAEVNGKAVVMWKGRVKDDCQLLGSGPWMGDDTVSNYFI